MLQDITINIDTEGQEEILITDCPICANQTQLEELPCNHKICKDCITNIYPNKHGEKPCPFCRMPYEKSREIIHTGSSRERRRRREMANNIVIHNTSPTTDDCNPNNGDIGMCCCSLLFSICIVWNMSKPL